MHVLRNMAPKVQGAATWNFKMVSQKLIMSDFFDSTKIFIWPISFVVEVPLARNVHGVEYWALLYCFYATSLKFKDTRFEKHGPEGTGGCNLEFQNGVPKIDHVQFFWLYQKIIWLIAFVVEVSLARNLHGVEYWALLYCFYATSL